MTKISSCPRSTCGWPLSHYPRRHAAQILNDSRLERIEQVATKACGRVDEHRLVDEEALPTVQELKPAAGDVTEAAFHPDRRREAAEQHPGGPQDAPHLVEHGSEVFLVASEVEHGVANDHLGGGVVEAHLFDGLEAKVLRWETRRQLCGKSPYRADRGRVLVHSHHVEPAPQQVHEVPTTSAPGIQYRHTRCDTATQQLVEEVDVDLAELLSER
jgi:hypothetical protein